MMASIRARDTKPEMTVRRFLHARGFRYRLHDPSLPGKPDIVLPKHRTVIEVRGCFWHQHPRCQYAYMPASNHDFWQKKLSENSDRDLRNKAQLHELGWRVFVIWECEVDEECLYDLVKRLQCAQNL
jgi:DNA mismatch endonuclease (patch repair protein)